MVSTGGKVLGYDEGIIMESNGGKVLGAIFGHLDIITIGIYVIPYMGSLDGYFDGYNDGKLGEIFLGD